ncbi:MAG: heme ABC transporter permease CcmC [Hyphomonadaceae bacterium]
MAVMSFFANPHRFMAASKWPAWGFTALGVLLVAVGVYFGLFVVPEDFQQGDAARIMFVHVPAMWLSLFVYAFMAGASLVSFVWRHALADVAAKSAAPFGAAVTALGLVTGSIWGYPTWGTWWEWGDARLVSVLVLFFIYLGYIAIWSAMDTPQKAARAAAILCLIGAVNLPIIHFSVEWFSTLHQVQMKAADEFKYPMYIVALGYLALFGGLTLLNMRAEIMNTRAEMLIQRRQAAD